METKVFPFSAHDSVTDCHMTDDITLVFSNVDDVHDRHRAEHVMVYRKGCKSEDWK